MISVTGTEETNEETKLLWRGHPMSTIVSSIARSTLSGRNGTVSRRHLAVRGLPNTSFHGPLALPSIARDIRPAAMSTRVTIPPTQLGAPANYLLEAAKYPSTFGTTVVLGSDRGLGLEMAKRLHEAGCPVVGTCRKQPSSDLAGLGLKAAVSGIDFLDHEVADKLCKGLRDAGITKIDTLMIVAGYFTQEGVLEVNRDEERKMFEICAIAPVQIVSALAQSGLVSSGSRIGFITSEGGSIGLRTEKEGGANYGHHMSKAAANMGGKLLAWDLKPKGIPLVMIHPGFLKTDMTKDKYAHLYEELGAVFPEEAVPYILQPVADMTLDTTGRFVAALGSKGLGLGVWALEDPDRVTPGTDLPW